MVARSKLEPQLLAEGELCTSFARATSAFFGHVRILVPTHQLEKSMVSKCADWGRISPSARPPPSWGGQVVAMRVCVHEGQGCAIPAYLMKRMKPGPLFN